MAFNTNSAPAEYTASAGQVSFPFTFKIFEAGDVLVYKTPAGNLADDTLDLLILSAQYTVSIAGDTGGSVTLLSAAASGDKLTIIRELPIERGVEYQTNGDLLATTLNQDQDYQTYLISGLEQKASKTLRFPNSAQGLAGTLPSPSPDNYLRWNATGTALENDLTMPSAVTLAEAARDAATTQAGITTTKATEASGSATLALGYKNEAEAFAVSINPSQLVNITGNQTKDGILTFSSSPIVPTPTTDFQASTKLYVDEKVVSVGMVEQTSTPMLGLLYNRTDDTYKRIGKNINTLTIDGFNEFTAWRSPTAERQNDNDTVSASPLTDWLDTSANLPFSYMKRYVISNLGAEVKAYNANSFTHADQTGVISTQQVMVKIPKFNYIQAKIVDGGKTYYLYAIATASFTLNALTELGFISPTITVWNPTTGVSSGTVASNVLTSALHPAFTDNATNVMNQRYYGAFNAVSGRSICGSTIKPTGTVTLSQCRTACQGFGTGFTQLDFFLESAKNILALVERGSHYFERGGTSLANKWEGYSWNTGAVSCDQDNGITLPLLNKTGVILDGSNRTIANSYRGIENYHSGLWRWVDGVSLSSNVVYLAKPKATFSDGTITTPYFSSGYTVPAGASGSYIQDFGAGSFILTVLGGSASTKVTDAAWTGSTALSVGGNLGNPSASGLAAWSSLNAASGAGWGIVARSGL